MARTTIHGPARAGADDRWDARAIGLLAGLTDRRNRSKGRSIKKLMQGLVLAGALVLALGSPALAAEPASNGATAINTEYCQSIGSQTYCVRAKGMINVAVTPSGNKSYVTNYRQEAWMTDNGEVFWQTSQEERLHTLTLDGVQQQMSQAAYYEIPFAGQTVCTQFHVHRANGEYQFFRIEVQPCG